jgi:hypothetical protein
MRFFRPDPRDIKRALDSLMEREYIARDVTDASSYVYCT